MNTKKSKIFDVMRASLLIVFCLQMAFSFVLMGWPSKAFAADPIPLKFESQIQIPGLSNILSTYNPATGQTSSDLLARYIQAIYQYGLSIAAILAAIVLMAGGVLWLTSAGDSGKVGQAKELITGSIIGIFILFGSWIVLNTVNPDLLNFRTINTLSIPKINYCCDAALGNVPSGKNGECTSGQKCEDGQSCFNQGDNTFSCINKKAYLCCQYQFYCRPMLITATEPACASTTVINTTPYNLFNTSAGYCTPHAIGDNATCISDPCANKEDGETCGEDVTGSGTSYCYNKMCWVGSSGKVGEPCGNEPYSKCDPDAEENGKTCEGDTNIRFRSCESPNWCCKFRADGSRINKE